MNANRLNLLVAFVAAVMVANFCLFFISFDKLEENSHDQRYATGTAFLDDTKPYKINYLPVIRNPANPSKRFFICLTLDCVLLFATVSYLKRRSELYEKPLEDGYLLSVEDDCRLLQTRINVPLKDRPLTIDPEPIRGELLMPIKSIGVKRTPS